VMGISNCLIHQQVTHASFTIIESIQRAGVAKHGDGLVELNSGNLAFKWCTPRGEQFAKSRQNNFGELFQVGQWDPSGTPFWITFARPGRNGDDTVSLTIVDPGF